MVILDVACYRFVETSCIDCDVQPDHIRITIKGKQLQLLLPREVSPANSVAKRSQTTGHLVVSMPFASDTIDMVLTGSTETTSKAKQTNTTRPTGGREFLEVSDKSKATGVDYSAIVSH